MKATVWMSARGRARASVLLLGVALGACRGNPTSPDLENSAEGKACTREAKIEDGEDNNNQIIVQDGRSGYVDTFADPEGTTIQPAGGGVFDVTPGGANGSQY